MVRPLLCQSVNEYYRIVKRLGLEIMSVFLCCVCGGRLSPYGWGERRHLKIRLRRAWCPICLIRYTILPVFVAPAKWYSYTQIERALLFISWSEFRSITAGLKAWEIERQHRVENGSSAGPSTSTVRLWWKTLKQTGPDGQWPSQPGLDRALTTNSSGLTVTLPKAPDSAAITILPEDSWPEDPSVNAVQPPDPIPEPHSPLAKVVLQKLRTLGKTLLVQWPQTLVVSLLAVGAWLLDGEVGHRCLAQADLAGRVIPCRSWGSPSPAFSLPIGRNYTPESYPPP